jgi:hypothetical protein
VRDAGDAAHLEHAEAGRQIDPLAVAIGKMNHARPPLPEVAHGRAREGEPAAAGAELQAVGDP